MTRNLENHKRNLRAGCFAAHPTGRKMLALLAIAAGATLAYAGGENCRPRGVTWASATPSATAASSAVATHPLTTVAAPGGYCPGGLPAHIGGIGSADPDPVLAPADLDAVDAAMIIKAQFPDVSARIRSVKLEPGDTIGDAKAEPYWKVEVVCGSDEFLATLDVGARSIHIKYTGGAKATDAVEEEQDTPTVPGAGDHGGQIGDEPAKGGPEAVRALDMFEAIDIVAQKLEEKKDLPEPVPADKITDRPQPKRRNDSTGSRW